MQTAVATIDFSNWTSDFDIDQAAIDHLCAALSHAAQLQESARTIVASVG